MKIGEAFPSNWLKAADLQGRTLTVAIAEVRMEDIGGDHKPVMYFRDREKGIVLNKTNAMNLSFAFGDDTDQWMNQRVELYSERVMFQGKSVDGIRIRPAKVRKQPPAGQQRRETAPSPHQETAPIDNDSDADDDVPF